jgi:hypothetical protein
VSEYWSNGKDGHDPLGSIQDHIVLFVFASTWIDLIYVDNSKSGVYKYTYE